MKAAQELLSRPAAASHLWRPALIVLVTGLGISLALTFLWYPLPPLAVPVRLLLALLLAGGVLVASLRTLRWLRADPARSPDDAHLTALLVLAAGCLLAMLLGGPVLTALTATVSGVVLLLAAVAAGVAGVALLGLATLDLEQVLTLDSALPDGALLVDAPDPGCVNDDVLPETVMPVVAAPSPAVAAMATAAPMADDATEHSPSPPVVAPPVAPSLSPARRLMTVLDSRWTLVALIALTLVAALNLLNRQGLLGGLTAIVPAEQAGTAAPAAASKEAPGQPMPIADVAARDVTVLAGPSVAGSRPLDDARSLAIAPNGRIYVLETGAKQIAMFDPQGTLLGRWGKAGQGDGEFDEPSAIAVTPDGAVHVADAQRNAIQVFSPDGAFLARYGDGLSLYRPRGLALGDDGSLYVADTGRNRALRLSDQGDQQATLPENWEARPAVIDQPTAAVQASGITYVAEPTRARLHRLTPDGRTAAPAWAMQGTDTLRSARLTVGPKREVVLAEVGAGRVLLICEGGSRVLAWRAERGGDPRAAAIGPDGALVVVDSEGSLSRVRLAEGC